MTRTRKKFLIIVLLVSCLLPACRTAPPCKINQESQQATPNIILLCGMHLLFMKWDYEINQKQLHLLYTYNHEEIRQSARELYKEMRPKMDSQSWYLPIHKDFDKNSEGYYYGLWEDKKTVTLPTAIRQINPNYIIVNTDYIRIEFGGGLAGHYGYCVYEEGKSPQRPFSRPPLIDGLWYYGSEPKRTSPGLNLASFMLLLPLVVPLI